MIRGPLIAGGLRGDALRDRVALDQGTRRERIDELNQMEESDRRKLFTSCHGWRSSTLPGLLPWELRCNGW